MYKHETKNIQLNNIFVKSMKQLLLSKIESFAPVNSLVLLIENTRSYANPKVDVSKVAGLGA